MVELEKKDRLYQLRIFFLFLVCGLSLFVPPVFLIGDFRTAYKIGITIFFLLGTILIYRTKRFKDYFPIASAFSIFSFVSFIDYFIYLNQSLFSWLSSSRMDLYVFFKILTSLIVVAVIILFSKVSGQSIRSIFLTKGNLRLGLTIGFATFLVFLVTAIPVSVWFYGGVNLTYRNIVSWAPWAFSFVFANGFKEELQFRGLFLKKYEMFLGLDVSNFLQAIVFTSAHFGETYSPVFFIFLILVFFLGLAFGAVMQKTDSLLGAVLFHAGSDIPVILGIFSNL